MTVALNVKLDIKNATRGLNRWERKLIPSVTRSALNRAGKKVKTEIVRFLSPKTKIKQKDLRSGIRIIRASFTRATVTLIARGRRFNVIRFKARETKKGLVAHPWGIRRIYLTGFIGNNQRTALMRLPSGKLKGISGPGLSSEFINDQAIRLMEQVGRAAFIKEFNRDLKRRIGNL